MAKVQGIRRFARFSLRSLMLLTLAVAVWLGYEARWAGPTQEQVDAMISSGGEVQWETSPWSLLRFLDSETYGRRIVTAQVPAEGLPTAAAILRSRAGLRELRVVCDGSVDVQPPWPELAASLRGAALIPTATTIDHLGREPEDQDFARWPACKSRRRYQRFYAAVSQNENLPHAVPSFVKVFTADEPWVWSRPDAYAVFPLDNGSLAEVLVIQDQNLKGEAALRLAVLLVDNRCADAMFFGKLNAEASIQDVDGDGRPDLAFEYAGPWADRPEGLPSLGSDPRLWLGLFAIEEDGFRSLLPQTSPGR
jgi:hypothetical protein